MSHPINDQIIENLSENYEIKQILLEDNVSISSRLQKCSRYIMVFESDVVMKNDSRSKHDD